MVSFAKVTAALVAVAGLACAGDPQDPVPPGKVAPPLLGFGTWRLTESPDNTTEAVSLAIQSGYRHIDCAAAYGNQKAVGKGIADGLEKAGLKRENIWVTSKLWNDHHGGPETVADGLKSTLGELGLEYLDLYLMHWPVSASGDYDYVRTWQSMEDLLHTLDVRHIGVCNFSPHQLRELVKAARIMPAVHQMELHPYLQQADWVRFHQSHGIHVTAYSPLGNMNPIYRSSSRETPPLLVENEELSRIAQRRNCTTAQVALAWGMRRGTSVIPKSSHEQWIEENFGSLKCELQEADVDEIEEVGEKYLTRFNNPSKSWGVKLFDGLDDA